MRKGIGMAVMLAALMLSACDRAPKQQAEPGAPATADPIAVMKALGAADQLARAATAVFPDERSRRMTVGDSSYVLTPARLVWSGDRPILISGGQGDDCHACAGTLAAHYLTVSGDRFVLDRAFPSAATGTSFGAAPDWQVRDDIASVPVIEARRGGTFQGYTCGQAQLVALTAAGPATIADALPVEYSDAGAVTDEKAQQVDGKIVAGTRDRDFSIAYSGSVSGTTRYQKAADGTRYQPVGKMTQIPSC